MRFRAFASSTVALPGEADDAGEASEPLRAEVRLGPIVRSAAPFEAVLPSWNLDVPPGRQVVVLVRVERDDGWSPWLAVGEWGTLTGRGDRPWWSPLVAAHGAGDAVDADPRVAVDHLLLERPGTAAQLCVVLRPVVLRPGSSARQPDGGSAAPGPATFRVHAATLCFSAREPMPGVEAGGAAGGSQLDGTASDRDRRPMPVELDVPFFSQKDLPAAIAPRTCSPTSVAMVLAHHGLDVTPEAVAERAFDARNDIYGNWPNNVQAAWSFGVPGVVTRFDSWRQVEATFRAGRPIVASIGVPPGALPGAPYDSTPGHLLVLRGFDAAGDVLVHDPAAEDGRRRVYRREDLDLVWLARGGTAYLFDAPTER